MQKQNIAEKLLIGEGPTITVISAYKEGLSGEEILKRFSDLKTFSTQTFGAMYLFDCMISDKEQRYLVFSGLRPTQACKIANMFGQETFIFKDEEGRYKVKQVIQSESCYNNFSDLSEFTPNGFLYFMPNAKASSNLGEEVFSFDFRI